MTVHQDVYPVLADAINQCVFTTDRIIKPTITFDQPIGLTTCVTVDESDDVFYATRKGRKWPTKFVRNRDPVPSNQLTLVLRTMKNPKIIRLLTAYVGGPSERETHDFNVTAPADIQRCKEFWATRALIFNPNDI